MTESRGSRLPAGSIFFLFGIVFLAPFIYNDKATENVTFVIPLILGVCFLAIGIIRFRDGRKRRTVYGDSGHVASHPTARAAPLQKREPSKGLLVMATILKWFAIIVVLLCIVGTAYMVLFMQAGGLSGVPLGVGIFFAGLIYTLSLLCKALGTP